MSIRFTGLRPGEKLYEEMSSAAEEIISTDRPKIKRIRGKRAEWPLLSRHLEQLRASLTLDGAAPVRSKLREILPEYISPACDAIPKKQSEVPLALHDSAKA